MVKVYALRVHLPDGPSFRCHVSDDHLLEALEQLRQSGHEWETEGVIYLDPAKAARLLRPRYPKLRRVTDQRTPDTAKSSATFAAA